MSENIVGFLKNKKKQNLNKSYLKLKLKIDIKVTKKAHYQTTMENPVIQVKEN